MLFILMVGAVSVLHGAGACGAVEAAMVVYLERRVFDLHLDCCR